MFPSYEWLRQNKIDYIGTGLIEVEITPFLKYHFHTSRLSHFSEPIHNHIYDHTCHVLRGRINHKIWNRISGSTHSVWEENRRISETGMLLTSESTLVSGCMYSLVHNAWHEVYSDDAICMISCSEPRKLKHQTIRHADYYNNITATPDVLWSIVREALAQS